MTGFKPWTDQDILLITLLRRLGGRIEFTAEELHEASLLVQQSEVSLVSYRTSQVDPISTTTVEMRYRSRRVLAGEVVPPTDPADVPRAIRAGTIQGSLL